MSLSKIFLLLCLSFIGGIFLVSFFEIPALPIGAGILVSGIAFIGIWWKRNIRLVVAGFCLIIFSTGLWRFDVVAGNLKEKDFSQAGQETFLQGAISGEPEIKVGTSKVKYEIKTEKAGKVLVSVDKFPLYSYGDIVLIKGELREPAVFEGFDYRGYLATRGVNWVMYDPEMEKVGLLEDFWPSSYGFLLSFKNKMRKVIEGNLLPPQSSLLEALIIGDQSKLSEEWKEKMNVTGIRHMTSVSGAHIVILSQILMWVALFLGLWRSQAFYSTLILLFLFTIMVDMPASAVRAFIFGAILLFGEKIGRLRSMENSLAFAAATMLAFNPLLFKFDAGFQLSFAAVLGIVYLKPIFDGFFGRIKNFWGIRDLIAVSVAAQCATLPLVMINFGVISFSSILVNLLIVPLLPMLMAGGLIFCLSGLIFFAGDFLVKMFVWPIWLVLKYVFAVIDYFAGLDFMSSKSLALAWPFYVFYYVVMIFLIVEWRKKNKFIYGRIEPLYTKAEISENDL